MCVDPNNLADPLAEEYLTEIREVLADPMVMDIVINRPKEIMAITVDRGWVTYPAERLDEDFLHSLALRVANNSSKSISELSPILSGELPNSNERVQIVIPPAAASISITIRKASPVVKTLEELEAQGSFSEIIINKKDNTDEELAGLLKEKKLVEFLRKAVLYKKNIIVSGATGSGKTTFMKSLIMEIPASERLITIEDVAELDLDTHDNKVHLFYSRGDEEGFNVDAKTALASCLRMRPSRILLAELRGDEAWEYIKSVNTGHEGSITSMHANDSFESFEQLTAFIKDSTTGAHLDANYIRNRLFSTIDIVLFFSDRKLHEIYFEPKRKQAYLEGRGSEYRGDF